MLILPPGHHREVQQARQRGQRGQRGRWVPALGLLLLVALAGVTLFSLTAHTPKSAAGCLNFSYTTVMGSEIVHECGTPARKLCADPHLPRRRRATSPVSRTTWWPSCPRTVAQPVSRITRPEASSAR